MTLNFTWNSVSRVFLVVARIPEAHTTKTQGDGWVKIKPWLSVAASVQGVVYNMIQIMCQATKDPNDGKRTLKDAADVKATPKKRSHEHNQRKSCVKLFSVILCYRTWIVDVSHQLFQAKCIGSLCSQLSVSSHAMPHGTRLVTLQPHK